MGYFQAPKTLQILFEPVGYKTVMRSCSGCLGHGLTRLFKLGMAITFAVNYKLLSDLSDSQRQTTANIGLSCVPDHLGL